MRWLVLVAGQFWALPTTLLGLLIVAPSGAHPYAIRPAGAWWWVANRGPWHSWLTWSGMAALTCGAVTVCLPGFEDNEVMIRHERQHLLQAFCLGALFVPAYYALCLFEWASGKSAYRDNPLEVVAYRKQEQPDRWG